jgi:hypothetical protein
MTKVTGDHRRDFAAYLHWDEEWGRDGLHIGPTVLPLSSPDGLPALEAFVQKESRGAVLPTTQPMVLRAVLRGKASLNWQIKQWGEMIADRVGAGIAMAFVALVEMKELKAAYPWLPDWVWSAVAGRASHAEAM